MSPSALRGKELLDAVERAFETGRWQGQLSDTPRRGHLFCGRRAKQADAHTLTFTLHFKSKHTELCLLPEPGSSGSTLVGPGENKQDGDDDAF